MRKTAITIETSRKLVLTRRRSGPASRNGPTGEEFDALLAYLDPDRDKAGMKYEMIRGKLIKLFECRGCSLPEDLVDETINRVARKIDQGAEIWVERPLSYFYGVARNVLMDYQRNLRRAVPLDALDESRYPLQSPFDAQMRQADDQRLERMLETLENCLKDLPDQCRELLLRYYQDRSESTLESRRQLADTLGIPANALRIRVHRIRTKLRVRFSKMLSVARMD